MRASTALMALLTLIAIAACASTSSPAAMAVTYIVVRHAEKGNDDPRDPSLSAKGQTRARALARQLDGKTLVAAYATAYKRTQQTALPTATAGGIEATTYDASRPAPEFASELRRLHTQGTVLIVGHSNTVPEIVAALCGCAVASMGESDYGRLYAVRVDGDGRATLVERTY